MEGNTPRIYSQFTRFTDRRKQSQPVESDRRLRTNEKQFSADPGIINDLNKVQDTFKTFSAVRNEIKSEIDKLDCFIHKNKEETKIVFSALSPVISLRRISSLPDNVDDGNYTRAAGLVAVAGIMLPEDLRDMKDAWNQAIHNKLPSYDNKNCQAPFSFIRGTFLEPLVNKLGKYGYILHEWDKSFADTKFGEKIRKLLKVTFGKKEATGRKVPRIINIDGEYILENVNVYAKRLKGPPIGKLIYRGMQRTTLMGAAILCALWIPSIIKAFDKPEETQEKFINAGKQTLKASVNVVSVLAGIGIIGALGASKKRYVGSVVGMGIGSVIGSFISSKINDNIKTQP
jgi:hypothetical protein